MATLKRAVLLQEMCVRGVLGDFVIRDLTPTVPLRDAILEKHVKPKVCWSTVCEPFTRPGWVGSHLKSEVK